MVHREGDKFYHTSQEQSSLHVDPVVSIESALATAAVFKAVAPQVAARAALEVDRTNPTSVNLHAKMAQRAAELGAYVAAVERLCQPEIDAEFLQQLGLSPDQSGL